MGWLGWVESLKRGAYPRKWSNAGRTLVGSNVLPVADTNIPATWLHVPIPRSLVYPEP